MTTRLDPPSAVAASLCLLARSLSDRAVTSRHPRPCGWCDYPVAELRAMVDDLNEMTFDPKSGRYLTHDARAFSELPRARQATLVAEAQSFEPEPMTAPTPAPADEETPSWM